MEGKGFRDEFQEYTKRDIQIVGVSADPPKKQKKFVEKYDFPFPMLCDESHDMLTAYGVWGPKKFLGREYEGISRITYLINKDGTIYKVYLKVKPADHARAVLADWGE